MSRCNTTQPKSAATGAKSASCCAGAKTTGSPGCANGSQGSRSSAAPMPPSACDPTQTSSGGAAAAASVARGLNPVGRRVALWDELLPRALPLFERFGPVVAAGVLGIGPERLVAFAEAMRHRGARYTGARIQKRSAEQTARAIREAAEWEAEGRPGVVSEPGQSAKAAAPAASQARPAAGRRVVIPPGARLTVAPPFVDRRWEPEPGYVGPFGLAGIGRDVRTGEAWE